MSTTFISNLLKLSPLERDIVNVKFNQLGRCSFFDITTVRAIGEMVPIVNKPAFEMLRKMNCIHWKDMTPLMLASISGLIMDCFGMQPETPTAKLFIENLRGGHIAG